MENEDLCVSLIEHSEKDSENVLLEFHLNVKLSISSLSKLRKKRHFLLFEHKHFE